MYYRPKVVQPKNALNYIVTIILALITIELSCGVWRARSDCTYVQSDLTLHFSLLKHFISVNEHPPVTI